MPIMRTISEIREQFPALKQQVNNKPLVYLDNAATTLKPLPVIRRLQEYYELENSNIHRGVHYLSQQATTAFENARSFIAEYIHAAHSHEIIFTRGTTESINLLASTLGEQLIEEGDSILITAMEHHSNMVPWQQLCTRKNGKLLVAQMNEAGETDLTHFKQLLDEKPKLVAIAHISNALGTINPVEEMIELAHQANIPVLLDGAQSIVHMPIDVQKLDCDFFAFSGHKVYAPMGVGVLYGKTKWLESMPPYQFGGEMVDQVSFQHTSFNQLPFKFEAGTPNVGGVLALETALRFMQEIGIENLRTHEQQLLAFTEQELAKIPGLRIIGQAKDKAAVVSFLIGDIHPFDLGTLLDKMGIAVRTGHHCAQPVMDNFQIPGTVRASFAMYTSEEDIKRFIRAVKKAAMMLS